MSDKVKSFLKPPAPTEDDLNLDALDSLDFTGIEATIEDKRSGGGEIIEASSECEGGGCKI